MTMLAIVPEAKLRDAKQAVELARKAVDAAPNTWAYWRILGMAQHFAGDDRAAVKSLARSLELHKSGDVFDYLLLAAANQKLGNPKEARRWFDQGLAWLEANEETYVAELAILRARAEALLGIGKGS